MNATDFFDGFSDVSDGQIYTLRRTPRLDEWPTDQAYYLGVTKHLFSGPPEDWELRQRFVRILCEFLYHDGRTFDALMYIAEYTYQTPEEYGYSGNGINALCGIRMHLNCNGAATMSNATLAETFRRFANMPALAINATGCLSKILDRQTDSDRDIE